MGKFTTQMARFVYRGEGGRACGVVEMRLSNGPMKQGCVRDDWQMAVQLARLVVVLGFMLVGRSANAGAVMAEEVRISVRIGVKDAEGKPAKVSLAFKEKGGADAQRVESNGYGLAFASLLAGRSYGVSADGYDSFVTISIPKRAPSGYRVELKLPPSKMKGKTASAGRGLVLFTYVTADGKPKAGAELRCVDGAGKVFKGKTNASGVARVEVPLGAAYQFSVDGYSNFESHTFAASPLLQTTEIRLEEPKGNQPKAPRNPSVKPTAAAPRYSVYESSLQKKAPQMRTRSDSVAEAKRVVRQAVRKKQRVQYATPPRSVKPSPKVTKQVMNGVYFLRQALIEEEKENPQKVWERLPVVSTLTRNRWDSMVLVLDVTCSMDPYVEEYLLWTTLARNSERLIGCVFFNDGDGRADSTKMLGSTGGVRHSSSTLKDMVDTMVKSISYGCSGYAEENDVEALLYAQQQFPHAKRLVLIADNTSDVRDLVLADGILKPVHVLLCDEQAAPVPNADYVTIAYLTRGSVHLLSDDFELAKREGNERLLRVGKWEYQYVQDRWKRKE